MKKIDYRNVEITGGFWKEKQELVRKSTVYAVYDRYKETGRFDAFKCDWKEGDPLKPHYFWDSDVAKWIEGVAYLTGHKREPELEAVVDWLVDCIEKNRDENGYFNIYFTVAEPEHRLWDASWHELYCAGHLMEAAVAYYEATGKKRFLELMCDYADYIERRFLIEKDAAFEVHGHEEIELALVRLYRCTGEIRYLRLAKHFIDVRGQKPEALGTNVTPFYHQNHKPVREQDTAEGHAVRAVYLYCGMADVAYETGDNALREACDRLLDNIIGKRMYVTGGIGSSSAGEAFTVDYDLNNLFSYTETCAAIGLALFAGRMLRFEANSKYSDLAERVLYNGFLSSLSLDGRSFFYENPLEILPYLHTRDVSVTSPSIHFPQMTRSENFDCSCCPPNIVRFLSSVAELLYTDDGETLYVHQYMESAARIEREGNIITVEQKTCFPDNGAVLLSVRGGDIAVAVRIPWWSDGFDTEGAYRVEKGYAYYRVKDGETLSLDFGMKVNYIEASPFVTEDCGRYAVMRGPVVYCTEEWDNGSCLRDIRLAAHATFKTGVHETLDVPTLTVRAYRRRRDTNAPLYGVKRDSLEETEAVMIPYYAFANRGAAEMQVWHLVYEG